LDVAQHRQEELEAEILGKHEGGVIERAEWDRKWLVLYLTFAVSGGYVLLGKNPAPISTQPVLCVSSCRLWLMA
jgi:hypothetical protein